MPSKKQIEKAKEEAQRTPDIMPRGEQYGPRSFDIKFLDDIAEKSNHSTYHYFLILKDVWAAEWRMMEKRPKFEHYVQRRLLVYKEYLKTIL